MRRTLFALAATSLLAVACGDDPGGPPVVEEITGTLMSPNGAEGAAVIEITGLGSPSFSPSVANGGEAHRFESGTTQRWVVILDQPGTIAITGNLSSGEPDPTVTIVQVAGPDNVLRTDVSGYSVEWTR